MDKLRMTSTDGVQDNVEKIAALFPDCVTEALDNEGRSVRRIDRDKLLQNLAGALLDEGEERYQFTWPDKRKAVLRDTSMRDDQTATNFEQLLRTYAPNTITKIL